MIPTEWEHEQFDCDNTTQEITKITACNIPKSLQVNMMSFEYSPRNIYVLIADCVIISLTCI